MISLYSHKKKKKKYNFIKNKNVTQFHDFIKNKNVTKFHDDEPFQVNREQAVNYMLNAFLVLS